jgi:hypothetical protein
MVPMKWLNLRDMPFILWLAVFSFTWWIVSIGSWMLIDDRFFSGSSILVGSILILRNLAITLPLTKVFTHPMKGWFQSSTIESKSLIGQEAEICSYDATPEHGQVKYRTDGAPLLLNIKTDGPHLDKGTRVWITHYDPVKRVYIVSATTTSSPRDPSKQPR